MLTFFSANPHHPGENNRQPQDVAILCKTDRYDSRWQTTGMGKKPYRFSCR